LFRFSSTTSLELWDGLAQTSDVLSGIIRNVKSAAGRILKQVRKAVRESMLPLPILVGVLADVTRFRKQLLLENELLRQQAIVAAQRSSDRYSSRMNAV